MWQELQPDFVPHRWFSGAHRQTIAGALGWRNPAYLAEPRLLTLDDGDQLVLHDDCPSHWQIGQPVAVLLHGLAGCHRSGYMSRLAAKLRDRGTRVFRVDMRGCGAGMMLARHSLHAGRTSDVTAVLRLVRQLCPGSQCTLVGFSLGGSITLRMLGEQSLDARELLDRAISVAAPLDLAVCVCCLDERSNRLYDRNFARTLWRFWCQRRRMRTDLVDRPLVKRPRTLREFDAQLTVPLGGFADLEDYYSRCSSFPLLSKVQVPTRVLFAVDDSLIATDLYRNADFSTTTQVFATQCGGHLGYVSDRNQPTVDPDWHWMDWRMVEWIEDARW